ncbi:MAG: DoxX family protein [Ectobacillus sp.]
MKDFLRRNKKMSFLLLIIRLYLGIIWFTHGWEKISGKTFDATGFFKEAIQKSAGDGAIVQGWWALVVQLLFLPNVEVINYLIPLGEFFVGLALLLGAFTSTALYIAVFLNFSYLLSGSVDINPQMILWSLLLLGAKDNAGRIGMDGWVFNTIKKKMNPPAKPAGAKPPM